MPLYTAETVHKEYKRIIQTAYARGSLYCTGYKTVPVQF
jgi:hypothetical protein